MISNMPAADVLWLDQATQLCARIQCSEIGEEIDVARAIVTCLASFERGGNQPIDFAPDLEVSPDQANEAIAIAVIRAIRGQASYMVSRNVAGESIATIVHENFGGEATFIGQSEALALSGAFLQAHIQAKSDEIGVKLEDT